MKGLELSREYYFAYGKRMIEENFGTFGDEITVGLVGEGSECLGFDDEFSQDHDFEPSFCMWIDARFEREYGFKLERAYAKLPKEFMGFKRQLVAPAGGNRRGLLITEDFFTKYLGFPHAPSTPEEWLSVPTPYLAVLSSGEIFKEGNGKFLETRNAVKSGYPDDVRRKKIAACLAFMAQSGQYNYTRTANRGESGAAQLAAYEFVRNAVKVVYLLNNRYCPFYKWAFRGMRELPILSELEQPLTYLLETPNDAPTAECKSGIIEDSAAMIIAELTNQNLSGATCNNLDTHAFSVTDGIKDASLRNMNIFVGD